MEKYSAPERRHIYRKVLKQYREGDRLTPGICFRLASISNDVKNILRNFPELLIVKPTAIINDMITKYWWLAEDTESRIAALETMIKLTYERN